jgi:chemotaxis protein histidine kinase CheA
MNLDLSQFFGAFFEEAEELLVDMERLLLDLDVSNPSSDDLNAIFRCAHSIKGGAATFGFTHMTELTHVAESILDRARTGTLQLREDMVDAFLETKDVLKSLPARAPHRYRHARIHGGQAQQPGGGRGCACSAGDCGRSCRTGRRAGR